VNNARKVSTRVINHPHASGSDPTRLGEIADDIAQVACPDHDESASVDTVMDGVVGVHGCCEKLLDAVERHAQSKSPHLNVD
jgi:hypothetical protein